MGYSVILILSCLGKVNVYLFGGQGTTRYEFGMSILVSALLFKQFQFEAIREMETMSSSRNDT